MGTKKETEKRFITPSCKFNIGVECYKPITCAKCGWNPEVAAARIRKLQLDEYHKDHPVISIGVGNDNTSSAAYAAPSPQGEGNQTEGGPADGC